MSDLITYLREADQNEAADEIERNRKEIDGLLELLRKDRAEIERLRVEQAQYEEEIERLKASLNNDMFEKMAGEIDSLENEIERLRKDRLCRCADEVRCEMKAEIERLNCALTISRGKHENAIAEIERLREALERVAKRDPLESIAAKIALAALEADDG